MRGQVLCIITKIDRHLHAWYESFWLMSYHFQEQL